MPGAELQGVQGSVREKGWAMSEKKIVVPEEMLKAAVVAIREPSGPKYRSTEEWATCGLEAALLCLSENPIVPTGEQITKMREACDLSVFATIGFKRICAEWQRCMFRDPEPEPEVPEKLKDILQDFRRNGTAYNAVLEAFRRGQQAK